MVKKKIFINIGEYKVSKEPIILECIGLGSCVGICLWDRKKKIGALAHVMLGRSSDSHLSDINPFRFADKAIDAMLSDMLALGAKKEDIVAKIFGGANLFRQSSFKIGEKNVVIIEEELRKRGIPIVAKDVGGNHGRSIWFDTSTGKVVVGGPFIETKEY